MENILVTGATGFVGSFVCCELLKDNCKALYLLVRSKGDGSAESRVRQTLEGIMGKEKYGEYKSRIYVYEGDVQKEQLGLKDSEYSLLQNKINVIYHCAASVKFAMSYEEAKEININGTINILEFSQGIPKEKFKRLNYVSTSYIAGNFVDHFSSKQLDVQQEFNNTYEQTKFECENLLQGYMKQGYPITIYRPSIVSSSSLDGSTHQTNIILKFIKLLAKEKIQHFFCDKKSSINIVPVDYFVSSMVYLAEQTGTCGQTFNIVNDVNVNVGGLVKEICKYLQVKKPEFIEFKNQNLEQIRSSPFYHFFNYVKLSHSFDDKETRDWLSNTGITCANVSKEYIHCNLGYCINKKMI